MRDEAAEVSAHDAVPCCAFSLVEFLLDILSDILEARYISDCFLNSSFSLVTFSMLYFFIASCAVGY